MRVRSVFSRKAIARMRMKKHTSPLFRRLRLAGSYWDSPERNIGKGQRRRNEETIIPRFQGRNVLRNRWMLTPRWANIAQNKKLSFVYY
jgi:hypothetical protein